jgi:hypothetical protein
MIADNGGKIYLALVSAPSDKLFSSTTAGNGVVEFFTAIASDDLKGLNKASIIKHITDAAAAVKIDKEVKKVKKVVVLDDNGNPVIEEKRTGLELKIPKSKLVNGKRVNLTIDDVKSIIANKLNPDNSVFPDRKFFVEKLISNIVTSIKGTSDEQILGRFLNEGILNTSYKQQGNINKGYSLSNTNVGQSLSEMLSEPMLKNSNSGEVYAVLEIEGNVEPVKSNKHESYPMAIRSKVGNKTKLHVLQEREKWQDRFADPTTGESVLKERMSNVLPSNTGVSAGNLMLLEKKGPSYQKVAQIGVEKQSGTTQRPNTTPNYTKAAKIAERLGARSILDYGAGLGLGSDAMRSVIDNVDSYEPNYENWKGESPVTYTNPSDINKKYDAVVNLNVLNVVPKDMRDAIVMDIFDKLNVGGNAIISARKWSDDVNRAKNFVKGPEEKSYIVKVRSGGEIVDVYQKGFDGNELVDYIKEILGDAATVKKDNSFGAAGVIINKKYDISQPQFQKATPTKSSYEAVNQSVVGRMLGNSERAVNVKKKLARGIPIIQQYLTSFKKFGEDIYESGDYKVGFINQEMRKSNKYVDQAIEAFKKSAKDGFPVKDVDVNNFIEGDRTALNGYPAYVPIAVTNMRIHIDALTDNLITVGAITDPAEIALFRSNKGKYFGRYYDLFINGKDGVSLDNIKEKLKNVDQSVIDAAKNLIRTELRKSVNRQNVGKTRAEIDKILENKVNDQIERILSGRENNFVKTPVKGSVNMKALTERMDIKPEIRALMGEVNNPLVRYYSTIKKMSEIAAGIQYLNEFRAKGLGKFLFEENDPNRPEGANFEISTDKNPNLQPLGGLWTYKEFYDELTANLEPARLNMIDRVAGKAFAGSKYLKTVANPGTHVKNVVSNVLIFVNNGYVGADLAKSIYKLSTDPKVRENLLEVLTKSNVLSNNIDINTIKSFVKENNDLEKIIADKFTAKDWKKYSYDKVKGWLSGAYQFEDEIFKILAFMVEAERYSKDIYSVSYEDLAASQKTNVDKLMSSRVKSVMPTFSRVPAFVQGLNRYLYLASFMAFAAESVRIEKNNFMIALKELADPRTRATGGKRLAGMTTLNYMFWSKTTGAAAAVGSLATGSFTYGMSALKELMDDEDDEVKAQMTQREKDLRLWVREFSNSSDLANIKITKDGISYIDIGAYHPFGFRHKIMNRFDQLVRDEQEGVIMDAGRALGHGLDPWLTPDFTAKAFIDALNDIDKYDKSISNPNDPAFVRRIDQATYFLQEAFAPGIVNNIIRSRKETRRGEEEKAKEAMMDTIVREDNIEFTKAFFFKFKNDWGKRLEAANEYYNDPINNAESKESIKAGYEKAVDTKKEVIKDIVKYYQSAIRLGANETELAEIVQKMAPNRAIAELIRGDFEAAYPDVYVKPRE